MDRTHLRQIVGRFASQRILVIGDLMLDEFIWGKVSRISPEAPVPVVNVTSESYYPGGAANVARNVREFTGHVAVAGIVGDDSSGDHLLRLLSADGIDTAGVERQSGRYTTTKTRIIARNQQVVRVDRERMAPLTSDQNRRLLDYLESAGQQADAVIVADYGKGLLSQSVADCIAHWAVAHGKLLTVDPHPNTSLIWPNATAVKPNRLEAYIAAGIPFSDTAEPALSDSGLHEVGQRLLEKWNCGSLLITLGEQGMLLLRCGVPPYHTPTRAKSVFDVSGAGDTAIALFTLGLAAGATPPDAAEIANCASGIVVGKLGTATVTLDELSAALAQL